MRGIYRLRNTDNGRTYIGLSGDITRRYSWRLTTLRGGYHYNPRLQADWREGMYLLEIIEELEAGADRTLLAQRERHHVDRERPYYHIGHPNGVYPPRMTQGTVTLLPDHWAFLLEYGDGIASAGIRRLIAEHRARTGL